MIIVMLLIKTENKEEQKMIWKKILFIFNPVAGRSQIKNYLLEIIETLSAAEFKVVCRNAGRSSLRHDGKPQ